jgi:ADP-dependent NAD(P)H-hydrate dehydratase
MAEALPSLPYRPDDGHKGSFGTVCVLGGQAASPQVMVGGPAFSANAALRCGAGLAVLAVPEPMMQSALLLSPSATGLALPVDRHGMLRPSDVANLLDDYLHGFHCLAVGPGLGADVPQQQVLMRLVAQDSVPMVIDADALNALAEVAEVQSDFRAPSVLTPHPGEYRRLARTLDIDGDPIDANGRPHAAEQLAQRLGCVVVLKGSRTVITDGLHTHINQTGNVALATAGSGDVLTGIIASFIAQFFKPALGSTSTQITASQQGGLGLLDCARLGVAVHGLAADAWADEHGDAGLLAGDLIHRLPDVLMNMPRGARPGGSSD